MGSWTPATIASLATAGGTLVLAVATFSAVRSANRTARMAERSLLAGIRPLLVPSRPEQPGEVITFADDHTVELRGGQGSAEHVDGVVYLTVSLYNVGTGMAVLHGWTVDPDRQAGDGSHEQPERFRRLTRDLYVPAGYVGFWQGAIREPDDPDLPRVARAIEEERGITVDLLYGDLEGGQRTITRIRLTHPDGVGRGTWLPVVARHWSLDRPDPR